MLRLRWIIALLAFTVLGCRSENGLSPAPPPACYDAAELTEQDVCALLGDACDPATGMPPSFTAPITVAPSGDMPDGVVSQDAHNNLDIIWHRGRLFFAFRTAPSHFADDTVVLYVVSTTDQKTWMLETSISLEKDLREPRFLVVDDQLFMYFARLGAVTFTFKPESMMVTRQLDGCVWSTPEDLNPPGTEAYIPWRTRTVDGVSYMIGYDGGAEIYETGEGGLQVSWLETKNGFDFEPVVPGQPLMPTGGGSETDWAFLPNGDLVAVSRNESGDEDGFGSKICRAPADDLGNWTCAADPKKYDSPLVFAHEGEVYLIGRRQLANDGDFDLGLEGDPSELGLEYQAEYWNTPKRCALWRVDPETLTVEFLLDLPSAGDTCFASAVHLHGKQYLVYNYSSPFEPGDIPWNDGQVGQTFIYRTTITLP